MRRDTGEKTVVKIKDVAEKVRELLDAVQKNLFERAKKWLKENTADVAVWKDFEKAVGEKKLIRAVWCETAECADAIREKTEGVKILNIPFDQPKKMSSACVHCGNTAKVVALFAKSY